MNQIHEIEISLEHAKDQVALRDALIKLKSNRLFKEVILGAYFRDEPIRLVHSLADPSIAKVPANVAAVHADMAAIAALRSFFDNTISRGDMAERAVQDQERELALLRKEAE